MDFSRNFFLLVGFCRRLFLNAPFIGQIEADLATDRAALGGLFWTPAVIEASRGRGRGA